MNKYFKISENDFLFVPSLEKIPDTLEDEEVLVPVLHHLGAGRPHAQHQLPGRGRGRHQREQGGGRGEGGDQTGHGYEGSRPAHLAHVQGVSVVLAGAQCTGCLYYITPALQCTSTGLLGWQLLSCWTLVMACSRVAVVAGKEWSPHPDTCTPLHGHLPSPVLGPPVSGSLSWWRGPGCRTC